MKASDFTTGGNDREKAMSNLLKTEKTDAVNTGLVEKADKSAKALKGDLYSVGKKGTHGAGSTALDAIARKRKKTSAADALDGKSRSQITGKNALTKKVQSRHNLNKSLKHGAKGVAAKATHNALKDSELEGTDDLVATTHTGAKLAGKARKHLRSGKDALEKKDSLGALSEKKYRTEKLDKKAAQKRMQFSKYFHRNVYENAAAQAGKKKALTVLSGGIKGMLSSLAGAVSQFFPLIIAFILAFGLISVVGGGAADEEQKSASLDGMPAWVTYDLVLACLNAHEQYGYPASALLGQMMIENGTSDSGSDLGRLYHNYGGVKYAGYDYGGLITGSVKMLTTEYSASGSAYKTYADFAVFKDDDSYMKYRCEHLYKQSNYTRVANYQKAIDTNNSELFLRALGEGGYYTASQDSYIAQYVYAAFSPIPISLLGFEETKQIGIGYLKNFAAAALAGVVMVLILYLYPHLVTALAVSGGLGKAEMLGLAQGVETFDSFGVIIKTIAVLITTMMGLVKSGSWAKEILGA